MTAGHTHTVITGGYFTRYIAMMLADQLDEILPGIDYAADPLGHDIGKSLRLSKGDVAVILDFRHHEQAAHDTARLAHTHAATTIALTDPSLSPAAANADIALTAPVAGVPFDTMAPLLVLTEAITNAALQHAGPAAVDRVNQREQALGPNRALASRRDIDDPETAARNQPQR